MDQSLNNRMKRVKSIHAQKQLQQKTHKKNKKKQTSSENIHGNFQSN